MLIVDVFKKVKFCLTADRLGPDLPFTHWRLHFPSSMKKVCSAKFRRFGRDADFRPGAYAIHCSNIEIGDRVVVRPASMLFADEYASIVVEDNVMLGAGIHCYVNNHRFDRVDLPLIDQGYYHSEDVLIKTGAWVGAGAIILPGVTIGENSVVGAGSVVTKSIPEHSVAAGCPARVIKSLKS